MHSTNGAMHSTDGINLLNRSKGHTHSNNSINGVNGDHGLSYYAFPTNEHNPVETPVLIVGGGPTGLLVCHLLSRLGIKSTIVERYPERLGAPKAHALSPRSLEICRQFGLDVIRIRDLGTPRADAFWVNFVTNLSGEAVGVLPYERMDCAVLDETPEMIHNIPQPVFEQLLTENLSTNPNADIRKGISFDSLEMETDSVLTTVEERASGHKYQIRSRHVIACDGAKSKVREFLRIESEGEDSYETMMTIHFNANLRPVVGRRVGMLHWIMDPVAAGFIIGYDLNGNQVLISNFDSDKHPVDTWNEELCRSVVASAIGQDVPFDVLSYRPWILSRKVAKSYRTRNVFLAGDAAHSFPPTGGLGLNSGLADVHNLAYKIAAVHKGWANDTILETYHSERQHVAEVNSKQSVKNGKTIFGLLKTLGTARTDDIAAARRNFYATIHDPKKKRKIDEGIEAQREHFDNVSLSRDSLVLAIRVVLIWCLQLELHIGYVYGSSEIPPNASNYVPKYIPGARLPHAWITFGDSTAIDRPPPVDVSYVSELSSEAVAQRRFTTLDLCAPDCFTFIIGSLELWAERIQQVKSHYARWGPRIVAYALGTDFDLVSGPRGINWIEGAGLKDDGGLLVRPDQHVQMRLDARTSAEEVLSSLKSHLGN